jgi:hypothetical protein
MAKFRMPPPDVVIIDPKTGRLTPNGYDLFKGLERLGLVDLADVSADAPANGQIPVFSSVSGQWLMEPVSAPTDGQVLVWSSSTGWTPGSN